MAVSHWHVATGIRGYGPEDPGPALSLLEAAEAAMYEAREISDFEYEGYHIMRDSEMFEDACKYVDSSDRFDVLARNLDFFTEHGRLGAPLFKGPDKLEKVEASLRFELANAPFDYDMGRAGLYVWECDDAECEDESQGD